MQVRSYRIASAYAARAGSRRRAEIHLRMFAAVLAALLCVGLATLLGEPASQPARAAARAPGILTCAGPCVGITNPLYQNSTVAEGPVGTHLTVEGAGWPASTTLMIWPGLTPANCAQQPPDAGGIPVDGAGNARGLYDWPASANAVGQAYTLCGKDGNTVVTAAANAPNTFTVLAAAAPAVAVSPAAVVQGATVAVSGQNWLPAQPVTISVCTTAAGSGSIIGCASPIISARQVNSDQNGNFQTSVTIPPDAAPSAYYVIVTAYNGALTAPPAGTGQELTVSAPTPTPTITPIPTATPKPKPMPPASGGGGNVFLIVVLGTLSLLFLVGGVISMAIYLRGGPQGGTVW